MATSTRTTFQPTAAQVTPAAVRGARQQLIERVSNQVSRRAARQIEAAQQRPNAPALAAPGGLVQRPGGEPLRPRATQATGATPVGSPVQYNQGIATGQPFVGAAQQQGSGFNGQEAFGVAIEQPEPGREYLLSAEEFYRSQVVQVVSSEAGVVATLTPAPGEVAEVGDQLVLVLDTVPDGLESVTISIELRRL
ncbi:MULTISPECIES: hypothetical protein [Cyanophyceae]|uniref:hypothetical protein n=1 Tax=Cyanophyceae TaxID=3028117 RepID=UPI001683A365|nr:MULTISPECIES: hypothetical protein [Cyanophyceae]MBD1918844.1 hypothetical protein [Phormidium sp. FACHB-77]MBD2033313.1 hypothetical protein [Phormidium sp. FACHB-322]MBD2053754.1 hypothetical protein [Leptolyngbya sp. FACHB-60]